MKFPDLDVTLEALAHLLCSEREAALPDIGKTLHRHHSLMPIHFDGFEAFSRGSYDGDDFDMVLLGDNAADLPIWPVDVAVGMLNNVEGWQEGTWQFSRFRTLDLKAWRGKLRLIAPRMIEEAMFISEPNGKHRTVITPYAIFGKEIRIAGGWVSGYRLNAPPTSVNAIDPAAFGEAGGSKQATDAEDNGRMQELIRIVAGLSLRRYYLWSVLIGEGSGPRARFVTDPIGVREAFRLRDIPPGKSRRAALLHWVKSHWRKSRSLSADDRAWVRAYLRGVWSYEWNGLRCQIEPSAEDLATLNADKAVAS